MATLRSSLPSRLRQLLSGEGAIGGPSIKLDSDTVSSFCPLTLFLLFLRISRRSSFFSRRVS